MINNKFSKTLFSVVFIVFLFVVGNFVSAESLIKETPVSCDCNPITPGCEKYCGDYSLNDIVRVGVNATQILLGLSGSVALLFFVYGGVTFLISGGSAEKVTKGKTIITNTVIGLIIIFASFMIIQFSMDALGSERAGLWYQSI